jgi:hypothetical protein
MATDGRACLFGSDAPSARAHIYDLGRSSTTLRGRRQAHPDAGLAAVKERAMSCTRSTSDTGVVDLARARRRQAPTAGSPRTASPVIRYDPTRRGTISVDLRPRAGRDRLEVLQASSDAMTVRSSTSSTSSVDARGRRHAGHSHARGRRRQSIRTFDLRTLTLGDVVASRPDRDWIGRPAWTSAIRRRLSTIAWHYKFLDPKIRTPHYRGSASTSTTSATSRSSTSAEDHSAIVLRSPARTSRASWFYDRTAAS